MISRLFFGDLQLNICQLPLINKFLEDETYSSVLSILRFSDSFIHKHAVVQLTLEEPTKQYFSRLVVSFCRDPELQVGWNYSYLFKLKTYICN